MVNVVALYHSGLGGAGGGKAFLSDLFLQTYPPVPHLISLSSLQHHTL